MASRQAGMPALRVIKSGTFLLAQAFTPRLTTAIHPEARFNGLWFGPFGQFPSRPLSGEVKALRQAR